MPSKGKITNKESAVTTHITITSIQYFPVSRVIIASTAESLPGPGCVIRGNGVQELGRLV